jgi:hypothetical protein
LIDGAAKIAESIKKEGRGVSLHMMVVKTGVPINREETKTGEQSIIIYLWKEFYHKIMEVGVLELISVASFILVIFLKEGPARIEEVLYKYLFHSIQENPAGRLQYFYTNHFDIITQII